MKIAAWHPPLDQPQQPNRQQHLYPTGALAPLPRVASVSGWHPAIEQPGLPAQRHCYPYGTFVPFCSEVVTADKWHSAIEQPQQPPRRLYLLHPGSLDTWSVFITFTLDCRRFVVAPIPHQWLITTTVHGWQVAPVVRLWQTKGTMISALKDPNSIEDFLLDWSAEIGAGPIASVVWP